jgi:GNAT superfamily N-acetyltransferase
VTEVQIRGWQPADARGIAEILREVGWWDDVNDQPLSETVTQVRDRITASTETDDRTGFVALSGDHRVGYASVHWLPVTFLSGPEGHLSELFVRRSARGNGIGERLVSEVVSAGEHRNASRLTLVNGTDRESYRRGFYAELGWTERDRLANFVYEY